MTILWDLLLNKTPGVRRLVAAGFSAIVAHCEENLLRNRVVPALITLASDQDINVRVATFTGFGNLFTRFGSIPADVADKVRIQISSFLDEAQDPRLVVRLLRLFAQTAANMETKFRDECKK